jgi:hypothetical protein
MRASRALTDLNRLLSLMDDPGAAAPSPVPERRAGDPATPRGGTGAVCGTGGRASDGPEG